MEMSMMEVREPDDDDEAGFGFHGGRCVGTAVHDIISVFAFRFFIIS